MGRPAIGKFTAVRLPPEMLDRIDEHAGKGKRAAFIRAAMVHVLDSIDRLDVVRSDDGEMTLKHKPGRTVEMRALSRDDNEGDGPATPDDSPPKRKAA